VSHQSVPLPVKRLLLVILLCMPIATAQAGFNVGGGGSRGGSVQPTAVNQTDSLKDFHHIMAVQASSQQATQFRSLIKTTEAAQGELKALMANLQTAKPDSLVASAVTTLTQALDTARTGNKQFVDGFSANQKAGLKDLTKRLEKADSDLEQSQKKLDQIVHATNMSSPELAARAENLDKMLTEFSEEQSALGREMSIVLATGQDLSFRLPAVDNTVNLENRKITVRTAGELTQVAAEQDHRILNLQLTAALTDLQQDIGDILQAQFQQSASCSERVSVRRAMLMPSTPASVLALRLHYERWACSRTVGQVAASEIAESDGDVEMKLTPTVEKPGTLKLVSEFQKIDVDGMMGDALRSGSLGDDLRDRVSDSLLTVLRAAADFKATLPPAAQNDVELESATFQDAGSGNLNILLQGRVQLSGEQVNFLASQLNQSASSQATPAQ